MKYLVAETTGRAGLDHRLAVLKALIKEAVILNRKLVIKLTLLPKKHNYGRHSMINFNDYIDLEKTSIFKIDEGEIQRCSFNYIDAKNFNLNNYQAHQILEINEDQMPTNNDYEVIIRKVHNRDFTWQPRFAPFLVQFEPVKYFV